jgi:DNA-binding transcriptional regulator YiaG
MKKKFKSEIAEYAYQTAQELFAEGAITEERMREYDHDCLVPDTPVTSSVSCSDEWNQIPIYAARR